MLDFFRNHQRLMMFFLLLIVLPGLGIVGIQGFRGFFDDNANVASVDRHKITRVAFDDALRQQTQQARAQLGDKFDQTAFDTPERRTALLNAMIGQQALNDEIQRLHLTTSDQSVRQALLNDPVIAQFKNPDGSINAERYTAALQTQGMTPEMYQESVRQQLTLRQIPTSLVSSGFTPAGVAQRLTSLAQQQRDIQVLTFKTADYAAKVQATDAQVSAYYDAHKQSFATPETATITYVVYSPDTIAASLTPSDDELHQYYQDNQAQYSTAPQVRVSHIFIAATRDEAVRDRVAAQAKATEILAEVRAHPDQFAQIAAKDSQDAPSAAKGGDLGFVTRGSTAGGPAFENAAFALKQGQISDVVQSDLGFHIIKATEVKPGAVQPFENVKPSIEVIVKQRDALKQFTATSDAFSSLVYEQAKSLQPALDKFKLAGVTATVTRTPSSALPATSPLNNPKFLAAVFATDSVKGGNNTQAVDIGNNTLIAAHVTHYQPNVVPPLEQIKDAVRTKYVTEQAAQLAQKEGAAQLAELQKSKSTAGFGAVEKVSHQAPADLTHDAVQAVFGVNPKTLPAYVGASLGDAGYAVYRVNDVAPDTPLPPAQLSGAQDQLAQASAQAEFEAYISALRARSDVKLYGSVTAGAAGAASGAGTN